MKKLMAILLAGVLVFTACSSNNGENTDNNKPMEENQNTEDENNENVENTDNEEEPEEEANNNSEEKVISEQKTPGLDEAINNQKDAEGKDETYVTIDQIPYTAKSESLDQIGATTIYLTLQNNSKYGIANYILKADDNGSDVRFEYMAGIPEGESSEEFSSFLKNGENREGLKVSFISYDVLVSETEGYGVRYNGEKNTYTVNPLANEDLIRLIQIIDEAK